MGTRTPRRLDKLDRREFLVLGGTAAAAAALAACTPSTSADKDMNTASTSVTFVRPDMAMLVMPAAM